MADRQSLTPSILPCCVLAICVNLSLRMIERCYALKAILRRLHGRRRGNPSPHAGPHEPPISQESLR